MCAIPHPPTLVRYGSVADFLALPANGAARVTWGPMLQNLIRRNLQRKCFVRPADEKIEMSLLKKLLVLVH